MICKTRESEREREREREKNRKQISIVHFVNPNSIVNPWSVNPLCFQDSPSPTPLNYTSPFSVIDVFGCSRMVGERKKDKRLLSPLPLKKRVHCFGCIQLNFNWRLGLSISLFFLFFHFGGSIQYLFRKHCEKENKDRFDRYFFLEFIFFVTTQNWRKRRERERKKKNTDTKILNNN